MAHQAIRRNIITGGLAPGFKLVVAAPAKRWSVGDADK
jgi:DNA-binding GntR family transcriptional regulator